MIQILGYPKGWRIPDLACCLRCRRSAGDHHACWLDVCADRTGEHGAHEYVVGLTGVYELTRVEEKVVVRGPLPSQRVQVHGIHGDVVDLGPHGALRRQAVQVSLAQRQAWGID